MNAFEDIDMFIDREIAARNYNKLIWGNKHANTKIHDHRIGQLKNIRHQLIINHANLSIIKDRCIEYGIEIYSISARLHEMFDKIRYIAENIEI